MASFGVRLRRALRIVVGGERLGADPMFDAEFYRWANPEAPRSRRAAARHYAVVGGYGRVPSIDFSVEMYVREVPGLVASGLNPLVHFIRYGRREQRTVRPHFQRYFANSDGSLDRDALVTFLRSGQLTTGRGSVLRALPHLLHAMPRSRARGFGDILIALANDRASDLGPVLVTAPHTGMLPDVSVAIVGDDGILAMASLAALMLGGEVGRAQVALPGEPQPEGDVRVEVAAGALVVPGSISRLVEHARRGSTAVEGLALHLDGARVAPWHGVDTLGSGILTARVTAATDQRGDLPEAQPGMPAQIGGATAVWWPGMEPAVRGIQRPRALVMAPTIPTPDLDSGSLCTVSYARTLASLGYRVVFVPEDLHFHSRYTLDLESWGIEVLDERHVTSVERAIGGVPLALALLVRFMLFKTVFPRLRQVHPDVPVVFAPLDLQHIRMAAEAEQQQDVALAHLAAAVRDFEIAHIASADVTIVLSTAEVDFARALVQAATVAHVPMARERGATPSLGPGDWAARRDIVFIGSYAHAPNLDAVHWFLDEVWPEVATRLPDARFVAYGSSMPAELSARADERVIMHGYVERLEDAYESARISVVPLRFGAGVKGKVASTMLAGIPMVATPVGVEGMDIPDEAIVVAGDARSLSDAIVALWHDDERLSSISAAALDVASTRFSFAAQRAALAEVLEGLPTSERSSDVR